MVGLGSVMVLLPVFAADILHVGPEELGLMRGMPAVGSVLMGVFLSTRRQEISSAGIKLWVSLIVFASSILVFSVSEIFVLSLLALFFYGASDMVSVHIRMGSCRQGHWSTGKGVGRPGDMTIYRNSNVALRNHGNT